MKIASKFIILFLSLLLFALVIGGVVTYESVKKEVRLETDYSLAEDKRILVSSIKKGIPISALQNRKIKITKQPLSVTEDQRGTFRDTLMLHIPTDNMEIFRSHTSVFHIDSSAYEITITDVFIEEIDMLEGVINTMTRLFFVIGGLFIVVGILFANFLLKPFHNTIRQIKEFRPSGDTEIHLPVTSTTEFNTLNIFLSEMMSKVNSDFQTLKEFTQNASHEIQTPLAIIKGKLELLQEGAHLKESDLALIGDTQLSLSRLSSLTDSLTLLTKLENQEFKTVDKLDFSKTVDELILYYKELALLRGLDIQSEIASDVMINIPQSMAEILVSNLLKNAIFHNVDNGIIEVMLSQNSLLLKNSGLPLYESPSVYFNRFKKGDQNSKSLGLGLSIVKKIVEQYDFGISYSEHDNIHKVSFTF